VAFGRVVSLDGGGVAFWLRGAAWLCGVAWWFGVVWRFVASYRSASAFSPEILLNHFERACWSPQH
jgi:hypothetical protein